MNLENLQKIETVKLENLSTQTLIKSLERHYNTVQEIGEQLQGVGLGPEAEALSDKQIHYEDQCKKIIVLLAKRFDIYPDNDN